MTSHSFLERGPTPLACSMADALGNLNDGEKHTPGSTTPNTLISHHVDVAQAEAEFNALSRQLTKRSELARQQNRSQSSVAGTLQQQDVEKARVDDFDRFDLREYLTSSNDANQKAGIKHKVCSAFTLRLMGLMTRPSARRRRLGGLASRSNGWDQ